MIHIKADTSTQVFGVYERNKSDLHEDGSKRIDFSKALHAAFTNKNSDMHGKCGANDYQDRVRKQIEQSQNAYYPEFKFEWDPFMPLNGTMTAQQVLDLKMKIKTRYENQLRAEEVDFVVDGKTKKGMLLVHLVRARCANAAAALNASGHPTLVGDFESWKLPKGKYMVEGATGIVYRSSKTNYIALKTRVRSDQKYKKREGRVCCIIYSEVDGKNKHVGVHTVVRSAYYPQYYPNITIEHLNGNIHDNSVYNIIACNKYTNISNGNQGINREVKAIEDRGIGSSSRSR